MSLDVHVQTHLKKAARINLGSFYTPSKYVELVKDWLLHYGLQSGNVVLDSSCGYGAFFELQQALPKNRYVGNDSDAVAVQAVKEIFPQIQTFQKNALQKISRKSFEISDDETLIVVGNPPYNDVTSQINQKIKQNSLRIDSDVKTRDLGLSFLLSYEKLQADFAAILHPLSYLIKKSNFHAAEKFFGNYALIEHVIFDSREFAGTSKSNGFPVIVAFYKRAEGCGLCFDAVRKMKFQTVGGEKFSIAGWDYVSDLIEKYPGKKRYAPEILFYTLRDINALKRSRTFLTERMANAIDVDPEKLPYYCYIDCFKRFAEIPYWMGNFDVPFDEKTFGEVADACEIVSAHYHPNLFKAPDGNFATAEQKVRNYIRRILTKGITE